MMDRGGQKSAQWKEDSKPSGHQMSGFLRQLGPKFHQVRCKRKLTLVGTNIYAAVSTNMNTWRRYGSFAPLNKLGNNTGVETIEAP